jgi:hypothetical protein
MMIPARESVGAELTLASQNKGKNRESINMAVTPTQSDEIQAVAGFRVREQIETTK